MNAQVIKEGQILQFERLEPYVNGDFSDKSEMLRGLADLFLFRLIQTYNSTKELLRQVNSTGAPKEHLKGINLQLAEIFTLLRLIVNNFYNLNDFKSKQVLETALKDNFLELIFRLAKERFWSKSISQGRLTDLHADLNQMSKLSLRPGLKILQLLLNQDR